MALVGVCKVYLSGLLSVRSPLPSEVPIPHPTPPGHNTTHLPEDLLYPVSSSVEYFKDLSFLIPFHVLKTHSTNIAGR